jgi:large subunit ribosomal protein L16
MLNRRPKKTKFLKYQKGRLNYNLPIKEENKKENQKDLKYVLIACEPYRLTASHIYAGELAIKRSLKKAIESGDAARWNIRGKLEIKVFPHIPVTKKPAEVRMGKGKGSIDY